MLYLKYKKRKKYILTDNNTYAILYAQVQEIRTVISDFGCKNKQIRIKK